MHFIAGVPVLIGSHAHIFILLVLPLLPFSSLAGSILFRPLHRDVLPGWAFQVRATDLKPLLLQCALTAFALWASNSVDWIPAAWLLLLWWWFMGVIVLSRAGIVDERKRMGFLVAAGPLGPGLSSALLLYPFYAPIGAPEHPENSSDYVIPIVLTYVVAAAVWCWVLALCRALCSWASEPARKE